MKKEPTCLQVIEGAVTGARTEFKRQDPRKAGPLSATAVGKNGCEQRWLTEGLRKASFQRLRYVNTAVQRLIP